LVFWNGTSVQQGRTIHSASCLILSEIYLLFAQDLNIILLYKGN
jgi:hypothetical protein